MKQQWINVGRIGGISDGVFAIAMTLLVLDLKLPELENPVSREVFRHALQGQLPHFVSWLISFAILCRGKEDDKFSRTIVRVKPWE